MKKVMLLLLLSSCATTKSSLEERVDRLEEISCRQIRYSDSISYDYSMEKCFINLDRCKLGKSVCWHLHERCVIDTNAMWKKIRAIHEICP